MWCSESLPDLALCLCIFDLFVFRIWSWWHTLTLKEHRVCIRITFECIFNNKLEKGLPFIERWILSYTAQLKCMSVGLDGSIYIQNSIVKKLTAWINHIEVHIKTLFYRFILCHTSYFDFKFHLYSCLLLIAVVYTTVFVVTHFSMLGLILCIFNERA